MKNIIKKEKVGIIILIIIILVFLGITAFYSKTQQEKNNPSEEVSLPIKATVELEGIKYESEVLNNASAYDLMVKLREEGKINFKEKDYPGMGKFIEEINGKKGDGKNFWIYYINGIKAEVGIGDSKINPGDVITWKYESYN